ncbi:hypothetical protein LSTR_LSTR005392 [Laodelphax striatellus]|uniref:Ketosynthase family 3 (KS3) domain-containing protein n=1 Tax=Laodelphax striatellus TaxID=195883 RepID=A0A482WQT6_LAOST|nr:hypothetical protein LSTR_LSTR005392 [Laodelphax striatellus]
MPERHEVVISGVGGVFPECDNIEELSNKLFEKLNLVTEDDRRWVPGELGVPGAVGKVKSKDKFDANFFGIHRKLCECLDPLTRLSMERSYEAIVDAGVNPTELNGSNTAVMMASCVSETEFLILFNTKRQGFGILGHNRSMQANRVSYILNLNGPSFCVDCTWSGGMECLQQAFNMVADGHVNAALVGIANLTLYPNLSLQYVGMGKLSTDGRTKSFSADADGYARAEACVDLFLQRKQDARRSYGTLVGVSAGNIGNRPGTYLQSPTSDAFRSFLTESYRKANVDPSLIAYLEADGCGLPAIDAF